MPTEIDEYLKRFAGMDDVLERVDRETSERPNAMMQSRPDQGALLTLLTRMLDAREALEVGTFTGYGAVCIARGLASGGKLTCLEVELALDPVHDLVGDLAAVAQLDDRGALGVEH